MYSENANYQFNECMRIENNKQNQSCYAALSSPIFYVDHEINDVKRNLSSMRVHMHIQKHLVVGKNELLTWIDGIEKTSTKAHKVERICFIDIDQLTQYIKLIATKFSKDDNFDMALFYNFISE